MPQEKPATRSDVKQIVGEAIEEFAGMLKRTFDKIDKRFDETNAELRNEMKRHAEETKRYFNVVAEKIHDDLAGANKDEISSIKDTQHKHEKRIAKVEEKVGIL